MTNFDDLIYSEEKKYDVIEVGMQDAVCCGIWKVGNQKTEYQGEIKYPDKLIIGFELGQLSSKGGPMLKLEMYTNSLFPKSNLCQHIEEWTSKKITDEDRLHYDLRALIGKKATLNIVANENWRNIRSILPPNKSNNLEIANVIPEGTLPTWVVNLRAKAIPDDQIPSKEPAKEPEDWSKVSNKPTKLSEADVVLKETVPF